MSFSSAIGASLGNSIGSASGAALGPSLASMWGITGEPTTPNARLNAAQGRLPHAKRAASEFPWASVAFGFCSFCALAVVIQLSEQNKKNRLSRSASSSQ